MPRGFLVKRNKKSGSVSYRSRCSDEDQDDAFIENDSVEGYTKPFNSPDSGYGHSPVTLLIKESPAFRFDRDSVYSPVSSPHSTNYSYPSPLTYTTSSSSSSSPSSSLNVERDKTLWPFTVTPTTPTRRLPSGIPPPLRIKRPLTEDTERKQHRAKKPKAARKLNFDDDNTSPVHGTIIRGDVTSDGGHLNGKGVNGGCDSDKGGVDNSLGGDFVCQLCKEQYPDPFSLAQHKCSRIVHVEYRCPECDKVFNCPANLASHRRWHKPRPNSRSSLNSPRILPASPAKPDGSKTFEVTHHHTEQTDESLTLIKDDLTSTGSDSSRSTPSPGQATPNEEGQYECEQCGKKFRRPANLRKHMQHHGEEETYPCQYCGQMFSSLTSRAKHVLSHAVGPKEVNCDVCGGSYQNKMALEQHVRLHHSNEVYPCKYCSSNFTSSPGLTRHINKRHPSENRQVILLQQLPV
ncbi:insulinoma-associated protein 1a-like [Asterias amurensis]|uniref:insulinoma-associated protein 1a-like n=1 Tax=Asterias amurensis TaxID=7602 RepID=UPI003AB8E4EC